VDVRRFGLNDNPVLHEEYKERLKRLHTGLWYRRMVEGEWVVAEGAIYPMLDPEAGGNHVVTRLPDAFERYVVGVDYATATVTVFLLLGKHRGTWYVIREYYHDAERTGTQKTNTELRDDFLGFLGGVVPVSVEVDPSAAGFQLELRRAGVRRVNDADNEVVEGIRRVSTALSVEDRLKIHASCQNLLSEMSGYVWDKKAQERGEDKPVKKKDHGPDALRYAIARIYGKQPQRSLRLVR
jgi:PBSX family phage terminase large subunit